jgi:hypothetical protein
MDDKKIYHIIIRCMASLHSLTAPWFPYIFFINISMYVSFLPISCDERVMQIHATWLMCQTLGICGTMLNLWDHSFYRNQEQFFLESFISYEVFYMLYFLFKMYGRNFDIKWTPYAWHGLHIISYRTHKY